ncbi:MAG: hypothetical protein A2600_00255 [Candidatus Lambdaproteobacteria bacterium RIFOXYD1_FULL_56_27]|nr:MAG: hypothetical protein A2426_07600 [Candidatus Lambdaproteobacteria bacterium RIFOXYC1_FULL_56_13]OGH06206.1 MAG: hypothetical protein A2600_00255 [Candidatus Lambdaproteobacteria bacterium RIFOXYD1_FULL_56_27]
MSPKSPQKAEWFKHLEYSAVGIEMGLSVAAGALIGHGLDQYLGTKPWMLFLWFFAGVLAGFRALWRTLQKLKESTREDQPPSNPNLSEHGPDPKDD